MTSDVLNMDSGQARSLAACMSPMVGIRRVWRKREGTSEGANRSPSESVCSKARGVVCLRWCNLTMTSSLCGSCDCSVRRCSSSSSGPFRPEKDVPMNRVHSDTVANSPAARKRVTGYSSRSRRRWRSISVSGVSTSRCVSGSAMVGVTMSRKESRAEFVSMSASARPRPSSFIKLRWSMTSMAPAMTCPTPFGCPFTIVICIFPSSSMRKVENGEG
mmetsp:Transcript_7222/g.18273  ORF Transcript_7222/g.18273 Transcript_7222/m.18273 type:complete len:217 (+) Transcript_7222:490-1140(+)